ncbi:glycosyltransferase family 9 protein [Arenibacter troitsensis]|uniref:DNA phosphorothioation-dependent restriction protein DptG n=1 Tax=Arenibacter troitsensis TaxID=188872 RepID=A0A1X7KQK9_9FLAO|nr:glycosyltransferase family 9 protein [Arenibacter troitsensis]SMG43547.1 DNA phosphorothioation-dependent restriction protein DptG [Arenibacter troitsensis]
MEIAPKIPIAHSETAKNGIEEPASSAGEGLHILVIRLSAMGDVAMTVPIIAALLEQYPKVKITVLTRAFFSPLFSELNNVTVYEADVKGKHKGVFGLWKLYKELKSLHIDMVADMHNVLRSNILRLYFKLGSIPFVQVDKGRAGKKALTSLTHKVFEPLKTTHQRYADIFGKLAMPIDMEKANPLPKRAIAPSTKKLLKGKEQKWIGIAPFAAFNGKMYPLDLMEKVVHSLNKTSGFKILLFGGGEREKTILDKWERNFENSINLVGKLTFKEELALISQLNLMLAMDSGNAHLAALFGIPTLTLWGVTHPYAGFYPFKQDPQNALLADREQFPLIPTSVYGNKYPPGYENVMRTIAPEDVLSKIEEMINRQLSR